MENENFESTNAVNKKIAELDKKIQEMINSVKLDVADERTAYSIVRGYARGWSLDRTISYYDLSRDVAKNIWEKFGLKKLSKGGEQVTTSTKSKQTDILEYMKKNVGQVVTASQVSSDVRISLPTFYNFVKANNQMFEKVKRGQFKIVSV
jgi:hypothetical protein